ncbi:FmdB family zinc ribbon protein [Xanthomonas maliensis]|uniref:FmdB family zinc ribbon protein n=1 Tax=Xanthomonas maliensis TaxID=1321368 RepID=UPI0003A67F92|nr:zinc ribbon domain-containing protein [Xanthomonas maliensis]KAB7772269.1 zinc ribbon domain-containing protein [Xanthomonas maliensis]
MPIYAFQCSSCGHAFDRLQKMADPDPQQCPTCAAVGSVRRQVTAPAFRLSGSGWYETDFKSAGEKKKNLVDSGAAAGSAPAADAASAKPAAATSASPSAAS